MVDILTRQARSELMARIRQKDTAPELAVRKALHAAGLRYVLHPRNLLGRPDLSFPKYRTVLFVHGCFWHGHDCRAGRAPSSNVEYWASKIQQNRSRDLRQTAELQAKGWTVLTVWECEIKSADLPSKIRRLVQDIRGATV